MAFSKRKGAGLGTLLLFCVSSLVIPLKCTASSIRSPTDMDIPSSLIYDRFPRLSKNINLSEIIFEVTENLILYGPNLRVNIMQETVRVTQNKKHSGFSYVLNGHESSRIAFESHIRKGKGLTIVFKPFSYNVMTIWGQDLSLRPLDLEKYPGILINTHKPAHFPPNTEDSVELPPLAFSGGQVLNDFELSKLSTRQSCDSGATRFVEIAVAYDNTFCNLFQNEEYIASAAVQALVDAANVQYEPTCAKLALVHIEGHCNDANDPYVSFKDFTETPSCTESPPPLTACSPSEKILFEFRSYWNANRASVRRDVAYFFSGFEDGTNTLGIAFTGAACVTNYDYGWVEGFDVNVFVHEVGHSLGAPHDSSGIMTADFEPGSTGFSPNSVEIINHFLDNGYGARCISSANPMCDSSCSSEGECSKCISGTTVPANYVPCTPVSRFFRCVKDMFGGILKLGTNCPQDLQYALREPDSMDSSVFCCTKPTKRVPTDVIEYTYSTVHVIVNNGGSQEVFDEYIKDQTQIEKRTLIDSIIVPNCQVISSPEPSESTSVPTPSTSISSSSSPMSPSVSPSASQSVSLSPLPSPSVDTTPSSTPEVPSSRPSKQPMPSPRPSLSSVPAPEPSNVLFPTPSATPSPEKSPHPDSKPCMYSFPAGKTFTCTRPRRIGILKSSRRKKAVASMQQSYGRFTTRLFTRHRSLITAAGIWITPEGSLGMDWMQFTEEWPNGTRKVMEEVDAGTLVVPIGKKNCCRAPIYVYVMVSLCDQKLQSCSTIKNIFKTKMRCRRVCGRRSRGRKVLSFSLDRKCPSCVSSSHKANGSHSS